MRPGQPKRGQEPTGFISYAYMVRGIAILVPWSHFYTTAQMSCVRLRCMRHGYGEDKLGHWREAHCGGLAAFQLR
jgi:hypothetical protein